MRNTNYNVENPTTTRNTHLQCKIPLYNEKYTLTIQNALLQWELHTYNVEYPTAMRTTYLQCRVTLLQWEIHTCNAEYPTTMRNTIYNVEYPTTMRNTHLQCRKPHYNEKYTLTM